MDRNSFDESFVVARSVWNDSRQDEDLFDYWMGMTYPVCIHCGVILYNPLKNPIQARNVIFVSSKCTQRHCFCMQCAARLIHQSLSLTNQMPKCWVSECNQPFKCMIEQSISLNAHLSHPYQSKQHHIKQYKRDQDLVNGYIRRHNLTFIPLDLTSLIHDFFKLVCYTLLDCTNCHSSGYHTTPCPQCNGGVYTERCIQCAYGKIYRTEPCPDCGGLPYRLTTAPCHCRLRDTPYEATVICGVCNGCGIRKGAGGRGECANCDGIGRICMTCRGEGVIRSVHKCDLCKGRRVVHTRSTCTVCSGSGDHTQCCNQCAGSGRIKLKICVECKGNGCLMYTDFNKVIRKQKYCHQCAMFYPENYILYWSECGHTFCDKCIKKAQYIEHELDSHRIPVCMVKDCAQELNEKEMTMLCGVIGYVRLKYVTKLRTLKFRKDKFQCCICREWHWEKDMVLFSRCGHSLVKSCAIDYIAKRIDNRCVPQCPSCREEIENEDIESMCGAERGAYVHMVETLRFNQKLKALIVMSKMDVEVQDARKVMKLRNPNLYTHNTELKDKLVDFISLTSMKAEDIRYIEIIASTSGIALFKLCFKDEPRAKQIMIEVTDLIRKNNLYQAWYVGWWEVYEYKRQRLAPIREEDPRQMWNDRDRMDPDRSWVPFRNEYNRGYSGYRDHTGNMNRRRCNNYNDNSHPSVVPGVFVEHQGRLMINKPQRW